MSKSKEYYSKIFKHFEAKKLEKPIRRGENKGETIDYKDEIQYLQKHKTTAEQIVDAGIKRRDSKLLIKIHEDALTDYINNNPNWKWTTIRDYSHRIINFIEYSPTLDPNDVTKFIQNKFKISMTSDESINELTGTSLRYYKTIKDFLNFFYLNELRNNDLISKNPTKVTFKYLKPSLNKELIFTAYLKLIHHNKIQDAVMLHMMFNLALTPDTLSCLTFDSVDDNKCLSYYCTKEQKMEQTNMDVDLYNDLRYLKTYKLLKLKMLFSKADTTKVVKEDSAGSIFGIRPTSIYSKFERGFGGKISWFKYTPHEIILCSEKLFPEGNATLCSDYSTIHE